MKIPVHHLHSQTQSSGTLHRSKSLGIAIGLLLTGWLGGSFLVGAVEYPALSNAAIAEQSQSVHTGLDHSQQGQGFAKIANTVTPAVVNITAQKSARTGLHKNPYESFKDFFGQPGLPERHQEPFGMGSGSGVIVSPNGYIITNFHVVDGAKEVTVLLVDKREFTGTVVGTDPQTDLAILKIKATNLPYLQWGDVSKLQVGDFVLAVGNPFGLRSTVTQGIVSALGRGGMGISHYEDFIQTDAAINPGNSGGALVNTQGELIGINTAIVSRTGGSQGVGFAIPASMAQPVFDSLVKNGKVVRGFLGVGIQEVTADLATTLHLKDAKGALVTDVKTGSPAEQAGLQRGDTIVAYQDTAITDPRTLQRAVTLTPIDTSVTMTVIRDGQEHQLHTTISQHPNSRQMAKAESIQEDEALAGVKVESLDRHMAQRLGVEHQTVGVVVTQVKPGSQADRAGLVRGDIISEINKKPIHSLNDYKENLANLPSHAVALVLIHRNGTPLFLSVRV
ncbi:MAG: MucD protein [Nitrospirales bacterium]|nr:MAG: MucD protein [Nitrospirales bacterium]